VRYGNVVGSRGSAIPLFLEYKEKGYLPITDPKMTRFWITLEQGVNFVLQGIERMVGGEVFVPKLPSMNIMDLARAIAPKCKYEVIGIRPGEKLHEVLITREDARRTIEFDEYYLIQPDFNYWGKRFNINSGKLVPENFEYNSESNPQKLTVNDMRKIISCL